MYKGCVFEIENGGVGTLEKIKTLGGSIWKGRELKHAPLVCICHTLLHALWFTKQFCSYSVSYKGGHVGQDKYCIVLLNSGEETSCAV